MMEAISKLKNNTYYYGDGIYYDLVSDFYTHSFDLWMYREGDEDHRIYLTTIDDQEEMQGHLMHHVRHEVAEGIARYRAQQAKQA